MDGLGDQGVEREAVPLDDVGLVALGHREVCDLGQHRGIEAQAASLADQLVEPLVQLCDVGGGHADGGVLSAIGVGRDVVTLAALDGAGVVPVEDKLGHVRLRVWG